jgi:ATP-dependent DNA helicase RecQ
VSPSGPASTDLDPKQSAYARLAQMLSYAQLRTCRHARIADYFGEEGVARRCRACDNCLAAGRPPDQAVAAADLRAALAAAARFSGRVGAVNLAAILGGRTSGWTRRNPWATGLSHYGALRWPEERLRDLIHELVEAGLLRQTPGEYPVVEITRPGRLVLAGQAEVEIGLPAGSWPAPAPRPGAGVDGAAAAAPPTPDAALLDRLRRWRLEVARADGVPAFVVFHDRTLAEIAARAPRDLAELSAVPGVGPAKLARYGDQILALTRPSP